MRRLVAAGVPEAAGVTAGRLGEWAAALPAGAPGAVLAIHPSVVPADRLAGLLRLGDRSGFVVTDLTDLEEFHPVDGLAVPGSPLYVLADVQRGDELRGRSPEEALPRLTTAGRSPLTVHEGISWLLQAPGRLERGSCFMTIGSRRRRPDGRLDARTPAIWVSGGTGRDGPDRRGAPKVGWCWAGNRHSWLGFASTGARLS